MRFFISIVVLLFASDYLLVAQNNYKWILIKESDNIEIYYRESDTLHYEELRFTTTYQATVQNIADVIRDIDNMPNWSYLCVETKMIKRINTNHYYYYYATDTPWPMTDRDVVLHITILTDSISGITTIHSENSTGWLPDKDDFVRIPRHKTRWVLTPLNKGKTKVEFYFSSDPGGLIPLWLLNSAISYGPIQTLTTLRGILNGED